MKRWIIAVCVLVVLGAAAYAYLASRQAGEPIPVLNESVETYTVSLDDSYADGVHTIEGSVTLATLCHSVEATGTTVAGNIRIDLTVPALEGVCLQRAAVHEFSVNAEAPEEAQIAVFVNGKAAVIE